jgi:hypothetical protein
MKNYKKIGLILTILNAFSMYSGENFIHPNIRMSPNYNIHKHPVVSENMPIIVGFDINLRNILEVNEITQLLTLEMDIRMLWKDSRLEVDLKNETLDYVYLNPVATKYFWFPDIYIDKAKDIRIPTYHNKPASLRIYPDQHLRYSGRINFEVACPMDFHRYPMDEQSCEIVFESFGYTSKQLHIKPDSKLTINPNITLPQFTVDVSIVTHITDNYELVYPGM